MPRFSAESFSKITTCHSDLQILFFEVIKYFDCKVIEGHRGQEAQDKAFDQKATRLRWPKGKHNALPSLGIDVAPFPVNLDDTPKNRERFYWFAGFVLGIAEGLKAQGKISHKIRFGGDWDSDKEIHDQSFNDLLHYELIA